MSEGSKKYDWQKIEISPHNSTEILDQMEFLHKLLDIDSSGLVIPLEERLAIHEELSRLSEMHSAAFAEEMDKRIEAARQVEQQAAQRAVRQADPWFQFRRACYDFRFCIWIGFVTVLISLPMASFVEEDLPGTVLISSILLLLTFVWAIWASKVPEE